MNKLLYSSTQREGSSLRVYYYDECNYRVQFQSHMRPDMNWEDIVDFRCLNIIVDEWEKQKNSVQEYGIFQW